MMPNFASLETSFALSIKEPLHYAAKMNVKSISLASLATFSFWPLKDKVAQSEIEITSTNVLVYCVLDESFSKLSFGH